MQTVIEIPLKLNEKLRDFASIIYKNVHHNFVHFVNRHATVLLYK